MNPALYVGFEVIDDLMRQPQSLGGEQIRGMFVGIERDCLLKIAL